MRTLTGMIVTCGLLLAASFAIAQRPEYGPGPGARSTPADAVAQLMEFDKDKSGTLTKAEVTDERLHRLFDRADADNDGVVTKAELTALATREQSENRGGPPGFGPPGGFGPGGPMMGPPRPGEILPPMLQQRLRLTPEQKTQLDELQKDVDAKLAKILTDDQKKQLKEMRDRGPGGFGPPGGPRVGRPGGPPGGPPPPPPPPGGEPQ